MFSLVHISDFCPFINLEYGYEIYAFALPLQYWCIIVRFMWL